MENKELKALLEELKKLKELMVYVMTHRKELIKKHGTMYKYFLLSLKPKLNIDFPLIKKYFILRKTANERYNGDIDQFYKDMFLHTKTKAIEAYGNLATAIVSYPIDNISSPQLESDVKDVNDSLEMYKKIDMFDTFKEYFNFCNKYANYFNSIDLKKNPQKHLSKDEIIFYARKIIEDIDPSLVEDFDTFAKNSSIRIIKSLYKRSSMTTIMHKFRGLHRLKYSIFIVNEKPIEGIITLVHEFMHFTNNPYDHIDVENKEKTEDDKIEDNNKIDIYNKYTEFISIYFENYAIKYLNDRFELPDNITNYSRHKNNKKVFNYDIYRFLPFVIYKEYGEFTFETFRKFVDSNNVPILPTLPNFKKCIHLYKKSFIEISDKMKKIELTSEQKDKIRQAIILDDISDRKHILGTLLFYKTKTMFSKKDLLHFSKLLRKGTLEEIKNDELYKLLEHEFLSLYTDDTSLKEMDKDITGNKGICL